MRIDLVALDLDGTLLDPQDRISPANRAAIERLLATGVRVAIVTGRGVDLPARVTAELGLSLPAICAHGALVKDFRAGRTLVHIPVPPAAAKRVYRVAGALSLAVAAYADERFWYLGEPPDSVRDMLGPAAARAASSDELLALGAPTFIRLFGNGTLDEARRQLADLPLAFLHFDPWYEFDEVAVVNRAANKRAALSRLCADLEILPEHVLAIGDARSDVPMLQWAGAGVAMGNAADDVKAAVPYTTASNAQDGVALAVERFFPRARKKPA